MTAMLGALIQAMAAVRPLARRTVILGTGPMARTVAREIAARRGCREAIVGVVAEAPGGAPRAFGSPVLGALGDLDEVLRRAAPGRVIVALRDRRGRLPVESLLDARVRGVAVEEATEVLERLTGKIAIEAVSPGSLAFASEFSGSRLHDALARALGVLVAGLGLVLMAPLLALVAIAIRLDSPGPVLFVQEREGLRGRTFRLLKFRTMHAPEGPTTLWARDNGDRITRIGRWLRRFRLDELPQFVNVLRGDMNLIGPRPQPLPNCDLFARTVPYYRLRSAVRPGVTGWAQVRYGYANDLEEETEKMRYDLYYIKHRSVWLDVRILLDTVRVVLQGGGAEAREAAASFPARVGSMAFLPRIPHRHGAGRSHRLSFRRDPLGMLEDPHPRPGPRLP
ncbi:MAG TPA: sugar transferase [Candidatus Polarisedimenticolia bacterium]|jgi:exopolysaccharide biosynthesis polyprenyl glycosylphosphotransferase|nr:sugar transferase [Candidatus Polarisedimenticolia bacterium]